MRQIRAAYRDFGGETWGNEPFGRPRRNEEDKPEISLTEIAGKGVGWIDLAHDGEKLAGCYEHGIEHSGSIK